MILFQVSAQVCNPNGISTDPANPSPALNSTNPSYWTNQFDWTDQTFSVNSSNYTYAPLPNANWPTVQSPFWNNQNTDLDYLFYFQDSDFKHEDGWELIKRGFGFVMGGDPLNPASTAGTPDPSTQLVGPYLILYNRYHGILRVFGTIGNPNIFGYNAVQIKLSFSSNQPNVSGLLRYHSPYDQPLDQKTEIHEVTSASSFPNSQTLFFHADFPVAYDPCTCSYGSALEVSFRLIDEMQVDLEGRIAALTTPIASIANGNGTIGGNDFLTALHREGDDVEAGVTTYKRTQDLIQRYKDIADEREQQAAQAAQDGKFPKGLKTALDFLDLGLSLAGVPSVSGFLFDSLVDKKGKWTASGNKYKDAAKAVGYLGKFASKQIKVPPTSSSPIPDLGSIIEGEMTFTGTIKDEDSYGAGIVIKNPGSLNASTALEREYPQYNEAMGIFAVLESPELIYDFFVINHWGDIVTTFESLGDLKYTFNPALPIDFDKTKILASIEIEVIPGFGTLSSLGMPGPMSHNRNVFQVAAPQIYTTPWVDLACLKNLDAQVGEHADLLQFNLKLLVHVEYLTNGSDGEPNRHLLQVTVPMTKTLDNTLNPLEMQIEDLPFDETFDLATFFTASETIQVWNDVDINASLYIDPNAPLGTEVTIIAGNSINVDPNVTIGPGINLVIESPALCNAPIVQTIVDQTYCQQKYKAHELPANKMRKFGKTISNRREGNPVLWEESLRAFPNPSNGNFEIQYTLTNESVVDLIVHDNVGRKVMVPVSASSQAAGKHSTTISLQDQPSGMYHAILRVNGKAHSLKLVKSSN